MNINCNSPSFCGLIIKPGAFDCPKNLDFDSLPALRKRVDKFELFDLILTKDGPQISSKQSGAKFVDKFELCSGVEPGANSFTVDSFLEVGGAKIEAAMLLPYNNSADAKRAHAKLKTKTGIDFIVSIMEKLEFDQKRVTKKTRPYFVG